jgi:hypothetical protein
MKNNEHYVQLIYTLSNDRRIQSNSLPTCQVCVQFSKSLSLWINVKNAVAYSWYTNKYIYFELSSGHLICSIHPGV